MTWHEKLVRAHLQVTDAVSHGRRMESDRYFVWTEDGETPLHLDDGHGERAVTGTTDLFTKRELDPWADALGESLSGCGIAWSLVSVAYEEDTGFWHWSWDWEVL